MKERHKQESADERILHQTEGVARIVDFSNGVMGFAITLLVVDIKVPTLQGQAQDLPRELLALWPQFLAYSISFYVIGENWIIYNRIFSHIERINEKLYWLDLLFLFFIAVLPFPTRLVSSYPNHKLPVLIYAGVITGVLFSRTFIWWYATNHHRLVHENLDPRFIHRTLLNSISLVVGYIVSAIIAFISPIEAVYIWLILAIVGLISRFWLYRQY
jgi:uncharacterized membrane protein